MIAYETIYSRFYTIVDDQTVFDMDESILYEYLNSWMHQANGIWYIHNAFKSISFDDDVEELGYTLTNPVDSNSDDDFVVSILAQYLKISWLSWKIDSVLNVAVVIGGKEEKRLQSNYKTNIARVEALETSLRKQIRDYGYFNNDYIGLN